MPAKKSLKRIFWVILAVTLIVWIGVGLYYLTGKEKKKPPTSPSQTTQKDFTPWTTEYSPNEPVKIIEGVYTHLDWGKRQFILESDGQMFTFTIPQDIKQFFMPGTKYSLRIYYYEKDGKLIFVSGKKL